MSFSRREFLNLTALALASGAASAFIDPAEAAEDEPVIRAIGKFIDQSTGQVYGADLPILGVNGYQYLVQTDRGIKQYPIASIQTVNPEHFPFESIVQNSRLGFRCDDARFFHRLPTAGGRINRIAFPSEDLGQGSYFDTAITLSKGAGMRPMVVFNPGYPRDDDYYRARVDFMISHHPDALQEWGNEMDNTTEGYEFWAGQDYATFAHFIKVCQDFLYQKDPAHQPIVGALVDVTNTGKLLTALVAAGVNLGHLQFAVHAYQSSEDLPNRLWRLNQYFSQFKIKPKVHCTELGAQYPYLQKGVLLNLISRALQTNVESIVVHQLFDHPEGGQPYGFGVVTPEWTVTYPIFMQINALVRQLALGLTPPIYQPSSPKTSTKTPTVSPPKSTPSPTPFIKNGQT